MNFFFDFIRANKIEFEKDKNWGLVLKLQKKHKEKKICDLNFTYLTLNFKEITEST